jgi:hypothetical protein
MKHELTKCCDYTTKTSTIYQEVDGSYAIWSTLGCIPLNFCPVCGHDHLFEYNNYILMTDLKEVESE